MATGINISKANIYTVLSPPLGVSISKALMYVVLDQAIAPSWTSFSFGSGALGSVYSQSFSALGSSPITYTLQSGSLPDGLTLGDGTLTGTPTVANTFNFTLRATNAYGTADKAFSITIADPGYPAESNVRAGLSYKGGEYTGTLAVPAESDVKDGVQYGANGTEFEGTLISGGGASAYGGQW